MLNVIFSDLKKQLLIASSIVAFAFISSFIICLGLLLSNELLNKIDDTMERGKTPHFLQMHAGSIDNIDFSSFASNPMVEDFQIQPFLNIDNNEFLVDGINKFKVNTLLNENAEGDSKDQNENLNIKYVITLDSDTNLVLETAFELIGTMAHILNTPVLNKENDAVIEGHGLIQPRIGINLEASRKSLFTKIYAGARRNRFIYKCNI